MDTRTGPIRLGQDRIMDALNKPPKPPEPQPVPPRGPEPPPDPPATPEEIMDAMLHPTPEAQPDHDEPEDPEQDD